MQKDQAAIFRPRGLLIVDKPAGVTSAQCVGTIKQLLPAGIKAGHAGTLDSFATGVLVVMVGDATRACESLMGDPKEYDATIKLGCVTPTDDPDSPEQPYANAGTAPVAWPTAEEVRDALRRFEGTILQRPPDYSALKLGGKRFSDRVRGGEGVRPAPRPVRVDEIELLDFTPPLVRVRVACGRGTYVRSIARDLGEALGAGGYLVRLRRTRVGAYALDGAHPLDTFSASTIVDRLVAVSDSHLGNDHPAG